MKLKRTQVNVICIGLLAACSAQAEEVYRYIDSDGHVSYSDKQSHEGYVPMVKTWKGWQERRAPANLEDRIQKYSHTIRAIAHEYQVDSALIHAVIHAESYYDPWAVSSAGAMGLMQLMPATAERFGVRNRQSATQNINGGVKYLKLLMDLFEGDLTLTLAAYNAGENAVKRHGNAIPPYQETQHYVKKVLQLYQHYQKETDKS